MADRNPNIPFERARDLQDKSREMYEQNRQLAAEKEAQLKQADPKHEQTVEGTPREKDAAQFPD